MSARPTLDELMTRSSHDGPIWRHHPSLRAMLVSGVVWALVMAALRTSGILPEPPYDLMGWAVNLVTAAGVGWLSLLLVDWTYHRFRPATNR